jgi:hypothetical protein
MVTKIMGSTRGRRATIAGEQGHARVSSNSVNVLCAAQVQQTSDNTRMAADTCMHKRIAADVVLPACPTETPSRAGASVKLSSWGIKQLRNTRCRSLLKQRAFSAKEVAGRDRMTPHDATETERTTHTTKRCVRIKKAALLVCPLLGRPERHGTSRADLCTFYALPLRPQRHQNLLFVTKIIG